MGSGGGFACTLGRVGLVYVGLEAGLGWGLEGGWTGRCMWVEDMGRGSVVACLLLLSGSDGGGVLESQTLAG